MKKLIRIKHPDLNLIIKVELEHRMDGVVINSIKFGLPQKASKLEKYLLKYVEIYAYDVIRKNLWGVICNSKEYKKFAEKVPV